MKQDKLMAWAWAQKAVGGSLWPLELRATPAIKRMAYGIFSKLDISKFTEASFYIFEILSKTVSFDKFKKNTFCI